MPNQETRYYYKTTDEKGWLNLKTPDFDDVEGYVAITKEEWDAHCAELEQAKQEGEPEGENLSESED